MDGTGENTNEDKEKQGWGGNDVGTSLDMCTLKSPMHISALLQPTGKAQLGWLPSSQVFTEKPDVELRGSMWSPGPEGRRAFSSCGIVALLVTGAWSGPLAPSNK